MNKVILIGRLTRDPEVRYSQGEESMAIARYTLAVDRRGKKDTNEQAADFINCIAFRKNGEFAEKYLTKGMKIAVVGRIQTGSYTNKDGQKFTPQMLLSKSMNSLRVNLLEIQTIPILAVLQSQNQKMHRMMDL